MKKIIEIISTILGVNEHQINEHSFLANDLNLDRSDLIQVITGLEDEYDIIIDYANLDRMQTVSDLNQCLENLIIA